jgi:prolyl-tRNA editing enzyme YbaK/EbsC (Cys-tRNA(Pro) deacylase)
VRSSDDVHDDLTARGVAHEIVDLPSSSRTAQLAAEALGVGVAGVVKSLVFMLDDERPLLALVTGAATVDVAALARETGASDVRLAHARGAGGDRVPPGRPGVHTSMTKWRTRR